MQLVYTQLLHNLDPSQANSDTHKLQGAISDSARLRLQTQLNYTVVACQQMAVQLLGEQLLHAHSCSGSESLQLGHLCRLLGVLKGVDAAAIGALDSAGSVSLTLRRHPRELTMPCILCSISGRLSCNLGGVERHARSFKDQDRQACVQLQYDAK